MLLLSSKVHKYGGHTYVDTVVHEFSTRFFFDLRYIK